jgi:hypothetical protein
MNGRYSSRIIGKHVGPRGCGGDVEYVIVPGKGIAHCKKCGMNSHRRWTSKLIAPISLAASLEVNPPEAPVVKREDGSVF